MRYFGDDNVSSLPVPGDIAFWPKNHPIQEESHREDFDLPPRDEKPDMLTDEEWEAIRVRPEDMMKPEPDWDRVCKGPCCQEDTDDRRKI